MHEGDPWWVASDIASVLGFERAHNATRMLDEDEKGTHKLSTLGGSQMVAIVSESGLYSLALRSRKPDAKRFRRWVTSDVLPAIRRTGAYSVSESPPSLPATYAETLRALADQVEATAEAQAMVQALGPPARAWSALADTSRDYSVGDVAKVLSRDPAIRTGRQRLFEIMVELGMVFVEVERSRNVYKPMQKHVDVDRLRLRMGGRWQHPKTGEWEVGAPQLRVTAKGVAYLHRQLGGVGALDLPRPDTALATG